MKILLTGGGSGGHITPLLAVARELKKNDPSVVVIAVCEKEAKFAQLFKDEPAISEVHQVSAGKYRRYAGLTRLQRLFNFGVHARNARDIGRLCAGYTQARKLLKRLRPDGIFIKGGFVGVPVGLAAAGLKIPFITHDSDTLPGLANRIIARWASLHATGMPAEFYDYPKNKTVYTGVPISSDFKLVTPELRAEYRKDLGLNECKVVIGVIGASQGASQLNDDFISVIGRLMQQHKDLGVTHIAGEAKLGEALNGYKKELLADEQRRVVVKGFVNDVYRYTGAADIVVSRASATVIAELAVQGIATILVPGRLAGDHQGINARHLAESGVVLQVPYGDSEGLYTALHQLLENRAELKQLASKLHDMAKPHAAADLAKLLVDSFAVGKQGSA